MNYLLITPVRILRYKNGDEELVLNYLYVMCITGQITRDNYLQLYDLVKHISIALKGVSD